MTLAIMQPYFLPYIGYMQLMDAVDTFILYDDVSFINRGWINRNRLLINGQEHLFTIPLKDASQNKRINEVHLADDPKWRSKLLRTIEQGYRKAPCYQQVMPITEKIINFATDSIADLVYFSLIELNQYLGITTRLVASSSIYSNADLKAQERILDICRQESATRYINPIGGIELYDKPTFEESGIKLNFIKAKPVQYPQFGRSAFVPWLSILDVLMFNDIDTVRVLLGEYELV
ncbi:WbqC family protein [Spirosoma radiotolerans]|uniref:WbqC-like protein n=1 Tax=Spirosoma radiotolerans TaxID=1379870 RepID=A0A0E3ZTH3_9BACT|nr:WbqC family protein [Spirosoma radiotolerans]AKD54980.1 WbqC-like protein [Spirosoma radiotolerans]